MKQAVKVLLVDDEHDFLDLMEARIKNWGYEILRADNGKEAIDIVRNGKIDIMVLDYMMPNMDGITVLKKIRSINKDIPVIMFTAYPDGHAISGAIKFNISAFVPKLSAYTDSQTALKTALKMAEKNIKRGE